jgi:tripartite-type tricarboxylate transporter receptor subunit TctC
MKILLFALLAFSSGISFAQQVVRIVVPFAAGGVQDILARSISNELGALIGRNVIVENRTGAGGTIGNRGRQRTDGSTLLLSAASTRSPARLREAPLSPDRRLTAVAHRHGRLRPDRERELPAGKVAGVRFYARQNPGS